jgi:hypothetical protein
VVTEVSRGRNTIKKKTHKQKTNKQKAKNKQTITEQKPSKTRHTEIAGNKK